MNAPLVSIITVNYNQVGVTLDLLASLRELSYPNYEVIVVDNGSQVEKPDAISELYPDVQLIRSSENLGFAGGNNLGIQHARGAYFLFLNNDTVVPAGLLEPLVETLEKNRTMGMVSPKIKFYWDPTLIQYAGYTTMNAWTVRNRSLGYMQADDGKYDQEGETHYAHGAAMMVPRSVVDRVGLMPEIYFLYYEELDWAERVRSQGYSIGYQPKAWILHKESVSTGKASPLKTYYLTRNRILFARRNFKATQLVVSLLFQVLLSLPKNILAHLIRGQFGHLKAMGRAVGWHLARPALEVGSKNDSWHRKAYGPIKPIDMKA